MDIGCRADCKWFKTETHTNAMEELEYMEELIMVSNMENGILKLPFELIEK